MERRRPLAIVGVIGAEMCGDLQIGLGTSDFGHLFRAPSGPLQRPPSRRQVAPQSHPLPIEILLRGHAIFVATQNKKWCNAKAGNRRVRNMASVKFLRRQAEKCAELARRTHDEDSRQRCEQLQRTYTYLAEVEEGQGADPERRSAA